MFLCSLDLQGSAELLKELVESKPKRVETLNLCLLGPIGAGKSSFINSVLTTLYGRVMTNAETGRMDHPVTSHVSTVNTHKQRLRVYFFIAAQFGYVAEPIFFKCGGNNLAI